MIARIGKIGCTLVFTALTGLIMAEQAQATPLITNGSFESGTGSSSITGWTIGGGGIDRIFDTGWQASDGSYSIDLNAFTPGQVSQTFATIAGVPILVTFDLSGNPDGNLSLLKTLDVLVDSVVAGSFSYDRATKLNTNANMKYSSESFTFTPTSTSTTLTFKSTTTSPVDGSGNVPSGPVIDNVVATAVPEPGMVMLMGSGLFGLFGWGMRKRRKG